VLTLLQTGKGESCQGGIRVYRPRGFGPRFKRCCIFLRRWADLVAGMRTMRCVFRPDLLPLVMRDLPCGAGGPPAFRSRRDACTTSGETPLLRRGTQQLLDLFACGFQRGGELVGELAAGLGHVGTAAAAAFDYRRRCFDPGHGVQAALD
jgi:hypothetical protein